MIHYDPTKCLVICICNGAWMHYYGSGTKGLDVKGDPVENML